MKGLHCEEIWKWVLLLTREDNVAQINWFKLMDGNYIQLCGATDPTVMWQLFLFVIALFFERYHLILCFNIMSNFLHNYYPLVIRTRFCNGYFVLNMTRTSGWLCNTVKWFKGDDGKTIFILLKGNSQSFLLILSKTTSTILSNNKILRLVFIVLFEKFWSMLTGDRAQTQAIK